jgi:RNA polymerase sigma-70 factor (ECF subfamily)
MTTVTVFNVTNGPLAQEFDELFREHYPLVYRTAYSVTGSPEDAEDVVQTIFLRLFRRGFPPHTENPKGYLYRAAVNASLNVARSRRHHVLTADEGRLEALAELNRPSPESPIEGRLVDAIAQLNPVAVEMLILRYEHQYSDAEIAKLVGKSRGVVAVTLYRARARLKKLLRASSSSGETHETK